MPILEIENLTVDFPTQRVLENINFKINKGETLGLLGPNGAGKSTLLNTIMGIKEKTSGKIKIGGSTFKNPREIRKWGCTLVPQDKSLFPNLTVEENLKIGTRNTENPLEINDIYIEFPKLEERKEQVAKSLSGGEQKMLSFGIGLISNPKILLVDELTLGLDPKRKKKFREVTRKMSDEGKTMIFAEEKAEEAMGIIDKYCLLEKGRIRSKGIDIREDKYIEETYLGL